MDGFAGFEPQIGEIRAVRSFRIGADGVLYPLFSDHAWTDGVNAARCRVTHGHPTHDVPDPDCTCGFYAYASVRAADEYPHARHVLAVVSCWGRVIAGTRGIRAQYARIEAIWMSPKVPEYLRVAVATRYPLVRVEPDLDQLLAAHPPTVLDCYEPQPPREGKGARLRLRVAIATALVTSLFPQSWLGGTRNAYILWAAECAVFLGAALVVRRRSGDITSRRRAMLLATVALWLIAPLAGAAGILLLRLPLLQLAALTLAQRTMLFRSARSFPADIG